MGSARALPNADRKAQGNGLIDMVAASAAPTPNAVQTWERSTGAGSLDRARGTAIVKHNGKELRGETDFTGKKWDSAAFSKKFAKALDKAAAGKGPLKKVDLNGLSWNGLSWNGLSWNGLSWNGLSWNGLSWNGLSWNGLSWNGLSWNGLSWNGLSWNGLSWNGLAWG
jgi:serine protease AprX